jgi:hypothetical protein
LIWQRVIGLANVPQPDANFFDVGGGPKIADLVHAVSQELDVPFTLADVQAHPRLDAMAAILRTAAVDRHEPSPDPVGKGGAHAEAES